MTTLPTVCWYDVFEEKALTKDGYVLAAAADADGADALLARSDEPAVDVVPRDAESNKIAAREHIRN